MFRLFHGPCSNMNYFFNIFMNRKTVLATTSPIRKQGFRASLERKVLNLKFILHGKFSG